MYIMVNDLIELLEKQTTTDNTLDVMLQNSFNIGWVSIPLEFKDIRPLFKRCWVSFDINLKLSMCFSNRSDN